MTPIADPLAASAEQPRERRALLALAVALLLFEVSLIGQTVNRPFLPSDETREAAITLELLREGSLAVPRLNHQPFVEKPPLTYILAVGLSSLVDSTAPGWLRAPQTLAVLGTLVLVFLLGRRLGGTRAGLLGAALLASCGGFISSGTKLLVDPLLMVFLTGAMVATACWWRATARPARLGFAILAGLSLGLGAAAKGPVAIAVHGLATLALLLASGRKSLRRLPGVAGIYLVSLVPLGVWAAELVREGGADLAREAFVRNTWGRFARGELGHSEPFWYYARILPTTLLPWTLFAGAGVVSAWSAWRAAQRTAGPQQQRTTDDDQRALLVILLGWSLGGLALLTASTAKRTLYLLPLLPAFCVLGGWWLATMTSVASAWAMRVMAAGLGVFGVSAGITLAVQGWWPGLLVVPLSAWLATLCWRDRLARLPARGAPALLTATLLASLVLAPAIVHNEEETKDLGVAFARVREQAARVDRVLGVALSERSRGLVCLALERDFDEVFKEATLAGMKKLRRGRTLLICDGGERPDLAAHLPASLRLESATDVAVGTERFLFLLVVGPGAAAPGSTTGG